MRWEGQRTVVDFFLMSCKGSEFAMWDTFRRGAVLRQCDTLVAEYLPTAKNAQVADFFHRMFVSCVASEYGARHYETAIEVFGRRAARG